MRGTAAGLRRLPGRLLARTPTPGPATGLPAPRSHPRAPPARHLASRPFRFARMAAAAPSPAPAPTGPADAAVASDMLSFINASWTQFHAVEEAARRLTAAGFVRLSERDVWSLAPGGRYFFTRSASTLVAFAVGGRAQPGAGFHMVGAHTDSPCLKVKPVSRGVKSGYQMVNVEPYGGGLWTTWFDRDLTVAGRVLLRAGGAGGAPAFEHRLVAVPRPILRVPMLAIHLQRDYYDGFKPNKQTHLVPVLATAVAKACEAKPGDAAAPPPARHHPALLAALAAELGVDPEAIADFDLNVCDTQPGVLGGVDSEFVFAGRLDNLAMSYVALAALVDSFGAGTPASVAALEAETEIKAVALFDHEEVGSASAQGAGGPVMRDALFRVSRALAAGAEGAAVRTVQNSFLVSADMAHALHPNYADKHEPDHRPAFGKGLVIKHNVNQRYATDGLSAALFREVGAARGVPSQEFCVRSDMACGSTIGPILASGLGVRTVDVGAPQLSMHSIREMCAVADVGHAYRHLRAFFEDFTALAAGVDPDALPPPDVRGTLDDPPCDSCV